MPTYTDLYVNVASSDWRDSSIMRKFQCVNFKKDYKKKERKKKVGNKNEKLLYI